jgi:F-type H+-transporting ATPase subunit gamma
MANARLIKRRIKSAQNISQITKAMELVAASKMKKAQSAALSGKLYADTIRRMVVTLASRVDVVHHPLLIDPTMHEKKGQVTKRLGILISTNKGLCGGLNTTLFRFLLKEIPDTTSHDWITLGEKGAVFLSQLGHTVHADFSKEVPFNKNVSPVTDLLTSMFIQGIYSGVDIVYTEFLSALRYEPKYKKLLPIKLTDISNDLNDIDSTKAVPLPFLIEPDPKTVFDELLPHYIENQVRDAILEAEASEHSARMIAMRNATDNATSLMDELTLQYNKVRQEKITYEITDMVTARIASGS